MGKPDYRKSPYFCIINISEMQMIRKKKIVFITVGILVIAVLVVAGVYTLNNLGQLYSDDESAEKYGKYTYYSTDTHEFVSPQEMEYYADRTTGGDAGWGRFFRKSPNSPKYDLPKVRLKKSDFTAAPSSYALYWLGHSSAIVELDGLRILIDPVLGNAGPFPGIASRYTASPIERGELPDVDVVLITHDHYDHLEMETIKFLSDKDIRFIAPLGVGAHLLGWGVAEENITELGWDESFPVGSLKITACPGVHYSGRSGKDRNKTLWAGYVIRGKEKNIFWSGDSGYGEHFKKIGEDYGPFDLACVEIDGWNAGWPNTHLFPEEAVAVCEDVHAGLLLPVHWGVFDLALHPWDESIETVWNLAKERGIGMVTPLMGEKMIPGETESRKWWKTGD